MLDNRPPLEIHYYLVAFIDVLGQQQALKKFSRLPDTSDETQMKEFIQSMKNTFGAVDGIQRTFFKFFESYTNAPLPAHSFTEEQMKTYAQCKGNGCKLQRFSDGIVLFSSLRNDINKLPILSVHGMLSAAASLFFLWSGGLALRGGIDVGLGWEANPGEIYGPVVAQAYGMENKVAQYPRIVFGDEFLKYLDSIEYSSQNDLISQIGKTAAQKCRELIATDIDKQPIIDYLGQGMRSQMGDRLKSEDFTRAESFVKKQLERAQEEKNTTLSFRYKLMLDYFESRRSIWIGK